jgi:predicted nucleic-acid-binding protein
VDFSNIINKTLVTCLRVNNNITTEEIAKTINCFLNNIVLGLDRILNKALKTYRLLIVL